LIERIEMKYLLLILLMGCADAILTQPQEEEFLYKTSAGCEVWVTPTAREYQRQTGKVYALPEDINATCEIMEYSRIVVTVTWVMQYGKTREEIK